MRIGFFGGTFNPPHNGHIYLALQWSELLRLDKVLITPTGTPPHKQAADVPGEMRLEMCRMAAEEASAAGKDLPGGESTGLFETCDYEVRRSGQKSYSVLTLSALHEMYPGSEFFMLMGADMFLSLESWHDFNRLKTLATFCTVPRDGVSFEQLEDFRLHLKALGCEGIVADVPPMEVSSSEIRRRVSEGLPISGLVPKGIEEYIFAHGLYTEIC